MSQDPVLAFGPYRLHPTRRLLLREDGQLVRVGSRAFDLLVVLVRAAGEIIPGPQLLATVWQGRPVEDGSLRVHVATLRKVLGDGQGGQRYIANVPMRGYCFVAPVTPLVPDDAPAAPAAVQPASVPLAAPPTPAPALPLPLTRLVGREDSVAELCARLGQRRCVTVVGPGGIGKTSVALAAARRMAEAGSEVALVELGSLTEPALVAQAMASVLGIVAPATAPLPALAAYLRDKQGLLVVLDNCEHLIDAVAELAELLLRQAPGVRVLCTSREALRAEGEWVLRLGPLPLPAPGEATSAAQALAWPAVQLFCERAIASADHFELRDADAATVAEVCRRLDGIPLAIELAAAVTDLFDLRGLAEQLGQHLSVLSRGRRTALARHQTLRATLDWSHALLTAAEQRLLRRLSVCRGGFVIDAVRALAGVQPGALAPGEADAALAGLVAKSLLLAELRDDDHPGAEVRYRLLETMREYAAEQLAAAGEADAVARRHAGWLLQTFRDAEARRGRTPGDGLGVGSLAPNVDDVRAAAGWALIAGHDPALGVSLMAWSSALWFGLSLMPEYRQLAEAALAAIDAGTPADPLEEMRLCEALGHALWHTRGGGPAMATSFRRALALAERLHATEYRLRCLWGLWLICNTVGDYAGSVRLAHEFGAIVAQAPQTGAELTHARMMALGLHFGGDQHQARTFAQAVLEHTQTVNHTARNSGFQFDQRVAALTVLSRVLWLQGRPDEALARGQAAVDEAERIGHGLSLCYAIANGAGPVAFWAGDADAARRYTALLRRRADERSLYFWQAFADAFERLLAVHAGAPPDLSPMHPATGTLLRETLVTVDPRFASTDLLQRARDNLCGWCQPELQRVAAERQWQADGDAAAAAAALGAALALAERQGAQAWALRCATSLAQIDPARGLPRLAAVRAAFAPGAPGADLQRADALLAARIGA